MKTYSLEFYVRFYQDNPAVFLTMVDYYIRRGSKQKKDLRSHLMVWGNNERTIRHWFKVGPPFEQITHYGTFFNIPWQQLVTGQAFSADLTAEESELLYLYSQLNDDEQGTVSDLVKLLAMKLENLSLP